MVVQLQLRGLLLFLIITFRLVAFFFDKITPSKRKIRRYELITHDRSQMKSSKTGKYPDIRSLYSTIARPLRMHMERVANYSDILMKYAYHNQLFPDSIDEEFFKYSHELFLYHDIGKCYISMDVYNKPDELTIEEFELIKQHTVYAKIAHESIYRIPYPDIIKERLFNIATYHHERWDGKGYPYGLSGKDIPIEAQLCSIADVYDGMISWKPYRNGLKRSEVIKIIASEKGKQFQSEVVDIFLHCISKFEIEDIKNGKLLV